MPFQRVLYEYQYFIHAVSCQYTGGLFSLLVTIHDRHKTGRRGKARRGKAKTSGLGHTDVRLSIPGHGGVHPELGKVRAGEPTIDELLTA